MPKFVDDFVKGANNAYDKAWNLGKDPKKASKPAGAVKRKHTIVDSKDATKTVYTSDMLPDEILKSENKTSPIEPIKNFGRTSPLNKTTDIFGSTPGIKGDNTQYTKDNIVSSFVYNPPEPGVEKRDKDGGLISREKGAAGKDVSEGEVPYSSFNRYTLMKYRGTPLTGIRRGAAIDIGEYNLIRIDTIVEPTITNIVMETTNHGALGYQYNYSDFAMCKYLGKIPNNYLITLRRFPFPVEDDIITPVAIGSDGKVPDKVGPSGSPDIARAVTWMSEATGNSLSELLSLDYKYHWEEKKADVQTIEANNSESSGGKFGAGLLSTTLGKAFTASGQGIGNTRGAEAAGNFDPLKSTYPNHVFGPYNKITSMLTRGEDGLLFDKEFTIKFQYEMKGLYGTNPKVLFMDQLANILTLTYSNAPFWGGEIRHIGNGSIGKPFGNAALLQTGNYGGFLKSVMKDVKGMATNIVDDIKKNGLGGSNLAKNLIGGALMDLFNSPQAPQVINALLTGDATGQWHLTVGNPLNPMMVMGNLCCTGTKVSFKGGNGVQDFPEEMEVEITLKPGRPRDKAGIESMFNAGRGRFYVKPKDGVDINKTRDVSEYGEKKSPAAKVNGKTPGSSIDDAFRKFAAD
jgi:hypothetical protein